MKINYNQEVNFLKVILSIKEQSKSNYVNIEKQEVHWA